MLESIYSVTGSGFQFRLLQLKIVNRHFPEPDFQATGRVNWGALDHGLKPVAIHIMPFQGIPSRSSILYLISSIIFPN
jgi:hypothetical protein